MDTFGGDGDLQVVGVHDGTGPDLENICEGGDGQLKNWTIEQSDMDRHHTGAIQPMTLNFHMLAPGVTMFNGHNGKYYNM